MLPIHTRESSPALWVAHVEAERAHGLRLPFAVFVEHLAPRMPENGALSSIHTADLYLACACLQALPGAAERFTDLFSPPLAHSLSRTVRDVHLVSEAAQRTLIRALVRDGEDAPALNGYSGRGPLGAWLYVLGLRFVSDLTRTETSRRQAAPRFTPPTPRASGEVARLGGNMDREHLRRALQAATGTLSPRDRSVLRLHVLEGLNIDEIGRLHCVHRATVARWLNASKEQLSIAVRESLRANLGLGSVELESLLGLADSQLDVSLGQLLVSSDE